MNSTGNIQGDVYTNTSGNVNDMQENPLGQQYSLPTQNKEDLEQEVLAKNESSKPQSAMLEKKNVEDDQLVVLEQGSIPSQFSRGEEAADTNQTQQGVDLNEELKGLSQNMEKKCKIRIVQDDQDEQFQ